MDIEMQTAITDLQETLGDLWPFSSTPTPPEGVGFEDWWEMWYSKVEGTFVDVAKQSQSADWCSAELARLKDLADGSSAVAEAAKGKMLFIRAMVAR